jgi:hypothetical protein
MISATDPMLPGAQAAQAAGTTPATSGHIRKAPSRAARVISGRGRSTPEFEVNVDTTGTGHETLHVMCRLEALCLPLSLLCRLE